MKRHLSILMLFVRGTLYRVLPVMALMAGVEVFLFSRELSVYLDAEGMAESVGRYSLSMLIEDADFIRIFMVAFALITLLLCLFGCDFNGKLDYTLQRLQISPMKIFLWQAGYNAAVYALLWMVQVYTLFGCSLFYMKAAPQTWVTNQSLFLEVHRSTFWFSMFPMGSGLLWVCLVLLFLCLGIVTARVPHCQRRRKPPVAFLLMMVIMLNIFTAGLSGDPTAFFVIVVFAVLLSAGTVFFVHLAEPGLDEA